MPADFHFLRPDWLFAIPVVILLAVILARRQLGAGNWQQVIDERLMPHVLSRTPGQGRDRRWWLLGLGGVVAALALAGPVWQRIDQPVFRDQQALVVALDLSLSMDAQDVSPSRLARARLKILDLLERRKSGQTALVVYSAHAFTVTPLTSDTDTISALVNSLSTDIMPSRGSYPESGIEKGRQLLEQAGVGFGEVLLITDGGASPGAERAARELREAGYSLSVLGVGTPAGAPIPRLAGGFVSDNRGQIAVARLEESSLRDLADAGKGRYSRLTNDDGDLQYLLSGTVSGPGAADDSLGTDQWREEGPWLVLLLLPLGALAFRRGWIFVLACVALVPLPRPAEAAFWQDLWQTADQQAAEMLESGDPAGAAGRFEDGQWSAVARYRAGDYAGSATGFAASGDARALYNLGNALAQQGEFDSAIDAWEQVLEMEPDNDDARYNIDYVKKLKEEQDQQEQEGDDQQSSENPGGDGEQSDSQEQSDQDGSKGSSQSAQSEQGDSSERGDEKMSEEDMKALQEELERAAQEAREGTEPQQLTEAQLAELRQQQEQEQALEQWLRRVPDDPGGLLRRKFRYQYNRYGRDQDGNEIWPDDDAQPW